MEIQISKLFMSKVFGHLNYGDLPFSRTLFFVIELSDYTIVHEELGVKQD